MPPLPRQGAVAGRLLAQQIRATLHIAALLCKYVEGIPCLLAGFHEQAATHALPNDELVLLQRSAEEAWLSDGVV